MYNDYFYNDPNERDITDEELRKFQDEDDWEQYQREYCQDCGERKEECSCPSPFIKIL